MSAYASRLRRDRRLGGVSFPSVPFLGCSPFAVFERRLVAIKSRVCRSFSFFAFFSRVSNSSKLYMSFLSFSNLSIKYMISVDFVEKPHVRLQTGNQSFIVLGETGQNRVSAAYAKNRNHSGTLLLLQ